MIKAKKIQLLLTIFVSAFLIVTISGIKNTFAALKMETATVKNSFTPMKSSIPTINENVTPNPDNNNYIIEKNDVTVTNTNDFDVYVRAMVIASWQDADGNVLAVTPVEGIDYNISYSTDWNKGDDGFNYYKSILRKGEITSPLLTACTPLKNAPVNGYTLSINIISQTVQSAIDNGELPFPNS